MLTGRSLTPGYCPACLDKWFGRGPAQPEADRVAAMHGLCREQLDAINAEPEPEQVAT